jgi:DNA-nicking Smr family endonuclease
LDFGKILDEWEKRKKGRKSGSNAMDSLIDEYGPGPGDIREKSEEDISEKERAGKKRRELMLEKPGAVIDLHGMDSDEAIKRVAAFIKESSRKGIRKVLIVHGKGRHSSTPPVLAGKVLNYVQKCKLAGEYGAAPKEWGGNGALWVILRQLDL